MVATNRNGKPKFHLIVSMGLAAAVMILGFQNCSVDLSSSTPGASSLGACAAVPPAALNDIQTVVSNVLLSSCATCHGATNGSIRSAFLTPDVGANASDPAVGAFAYTQLCVRGGQAVGLKIDGSNSHTGGVFSRSGAQAPLFNFLTTYF